MADDPTKFQASRIKLQRARKHINELARMQDEWRGRIKSDHTTSVFGNVSAGPVDEEFGAVVGDAIHNLRAALDLMAVELARANGATKTSDVYFPFGMDEASFELAITKKKFNKAGEDAVALLRTFQPYKSGNHALRAIHDLDVEDKHERLLPHSMAIHTATVRVHIDGNGKVELVREPDLPGAGGSLAFPEGYPFAGEEIIPTLESLLSLAAGVLEAFAALAPKREA